MNNPKQEAELREQLGALDVDDNMGGYTMLDDEAIDEIVNLTNAHTTKLLNEMLERIYQANVAEPCEPECTEIRHARHEGGWEHEQKIDSVIEKEREKLK